MIRESRPADDSEIERLALAQYRRTPWPLDGAFPKPDLVHICERAGRIAACCGFRFERGAIRVMHVWAEDGFGGRRAAVELMLDLEALADAGGSDLVFDTMPSNLGLRKAVEEHGCEGEASRPDAIVYRRKARVASRADQP
jgi:hypothetical protein